MNADQTLTTVLSVVTLENDTPSFAASFSMGGAWLEHATSCL